MSSAAGQTAPTIRHPLRPLIARIDPEGHRQATWLELFFDLCFVVAIAALARAFHGDPTWEGAAIFIGLFIPLWWSWIGFTWFANTFDNDDVPYRVTVFGGMLAVVWLASSVEAAADGRAFAFALAYIVLQLLVISLWVRARRHVPAHPDGHTHDRIASFLNRQLVVGSIGLVPWVVSLGVDGAARYSLWAAGLVLQIFGPYIGLRAFGSEQDWHVEEHHADRARAAYGVAMPEGERLLPATDLFHLDHIQERYGLFTIIVLGESVLAVSIGISDVGWDATAMLTASLAFLAAVSIWWTYFDRSGRDALTSGLNAAFVWGYAHFAIFAGIAALGVGTELMIETAAAGAAEHAADEAEVAVGHAGGVPGTAIFAGGAASFWIGMTVINLANLGFRLTRLGRWFIPARLLLAALLIVLALVDIDPLPFAAAAGGMMLALNALETAAVYRFQLARAAREGATP